MSRRIIGVNEAAAFFGLEIREFRDRLWELHEEHGGIIFKKSEARNAKLWTTKEALRKHFPEAFGEITSLDIIELVEMNQELRRRLERVEKKVGAK